MSIIGSTFLNRGTLLQRNDVLLNLLIYGGLVCWRGKVQMMMNEIE